MVKYGERLFLGWSVFASKQVLVSQKEVYQPSLKQESPMRLCLTFSREVWALGQPNMHVVGLWEKTRVPGENL